MNKEVKIKRRFATFGEQYRITKLIDEHTTIIHKDTDGTEIREFKPGWTMERCGQEVHPELHKRHVQHIAEQLGMKFKQPPMNGDENDLRAKIADLEQRIVQLEELIAPLK